MSEVNELWGKLKKSLKDGLEVVAEKTQEVGQIGKVKLEIMGIKRRIAKQFTELGGKVYHLYKEDNVKDLSDRDDVKAIVGLVSSLEQDLSDKEKELEEISSEKEVSSEEEVSSEKEVTAEEEKVSEEEKASEDEKDGGKPEDETSDDDKTTKAAE